MLTSSPGRYSSLSVVKITSGNGADSYSISDVSPLKSPHLPLSLRKPFVIKHPFCNSSSSMKTFFCISSSAL